MLKSRPDHYGSVAVTLHWLSAAVLLGLLATGFLAADAATPQAQATLLRLHVPLGAVALVLTLARLAWWRVFDLRRPLAASLAMPAWQARLARGMYRALYVVLALMLGSGIALLWLSGAGMVLFDGMAAAMPNFGAYPPRWVHGVSARVLILLIVLHASAALHHHFLRRDGALARMWYERRG